ncbi:MAG: helix-turn-helix transcriptional regulator [Proteobacteria bacterium]|nr:helix-turn-helix transcriptional regulator [Pseudomonadota bacterium]
MTRQVNKRDNAEAQDDLVFKALSGKDRRRILDLLRDGPMKTGDLDARLPHLDRTTVMQHLRVLENARLVISKKAGRCRWNYLDVGPIQRIYERWIEAYAAPSAGLLSQLRRDLEDLS